MTRPCVSAYKCFSLAHSSVKKNGFQRKQKGIYKKAQTKDSTSKPKILSSQNQAWIDSVWVLALKYILYAWQASRGLRVYPPQAWHSVSQEEEGDRENKRHGCFCSVCRRLMGTQQQTVTQAQTHTTPSQMDKPVMFTERHEPDCKNQSLLIAGTQQSANKHHVK